MSSTDQFASALSRAYALLDDHPPHHPAVRVAMAEMMAILDGGEPVVLEVTTAGLVAASGIPTSGSRELAMTLLHEGVEKVELDGAVTSEELERFLADARASRRRQIPPESRPVSSISHPALARSVGAWFATSSAVPVEVGDVGDSPEGPNAEPIPLPDTFELAVRRYADQPEGRLADRILEMAPAEDAEALALGVEALILSGAGRGGDPRVALARRAASPEALGMLTSWLARAREPTRRTALLRVAVALGAPMARTLGAELSEAQSRDVREACLDALVTLGPAARAVAESMIEDSRWFVVRNAVRLLPDVAGRAAGEPLADMLRNPHPRIRVEAITGLVRIGGTQAVPLVSGLLEDEDPDVRRAAAQALGAIGGDEVGAALVRRLEREEEPEVLVCVIRSLGRIGVDGAVQPLERLAGARFFSRSPTEVRIAALQALWDTGSPRARSAVMQALEDRDPEIRGSVRTLLGGR